MFPKSNCSKITRALSEKWRHNLDVLAGLRAAQRTQGVLRGVVERVSGQLPQDQVKINLAVLVGGVGVTDRLPG